MGSSHGAGSARREDIIGGGFHQSKSSCSREKHRWHLINGVYDETDDTPDEHAEFIRSVREFHCQLLVEFECRPPSSALASARLMTGSSFGAASSFASSDSDTDSEDSDDDMALAWMSSWRVAEGDEYMARFAQPYPARPTWAALPQPPSTLDQELGVALPIRPYNWPSDFNCAPLVCLVLRDQPESVAQVERIIANLACHSAGLLINARAVKDPDLRFILVALRQPSSHFSHASLHPSTPGYCCGSSASAPQFSGGPGRGYVCNEPLSRAEQRQMVWAVVHEVLHDTLGGDQTDLVEDIYMLRSVYLYDRLFKWLGRTKTIHGPLRMLSQEEVDLIVHEFGEETATHFLFVNQYLRHLRIAALVSLSCLLVTAFDRCGLFGNREWVENMKRFFLVCFLPIWGFHFLASWRSTACKASFRWLASLGSVQNSVKQVARAQAMESAAEQRARYLRVFCLCVPLLLLQMLVVFTVTVTFVCFEVYIYDVAWELMTQSIRVVAFVMYNVSFGVVFILILGLFHPLSKIVTTWEGHPDRELFDWHFTAKIYANWFLAVFLYFFVIAFCYIPFGDNIAEGIASLYPDDADSTKDGAHKYSINGALQKFRPDLHRLAVDVALFFLLQDSARLMQVLIPVVRAAWGLRKMKGVQSKRQRLKRRAILNAVLSMFRFRLRFWRSRCREARGKVSSKADTGEARYRRGVELQMIQRKVDLAPPDSPRQASDVLHDGGVIVAFVVIESVEIERRADASAQGRSDVFMFDIPEAARPDAVLVSCGLEIPGGDGHGPSVSAHVRVCDDISRKRVVREDPDDVVPDVITLTLHPRVLNAQAIACGAGSTSAGDFAAASRRGMLRRPMGDADDDLDESSEDTTSRSSDDDPAVVKVGSFCGCTPPKPEPIRRGSTYVSPETLAGLSSVRLRLRAELLGSSRSRGGSVGSDRARGSSDCVGEAFEAPLEVPLRLGVAPVRGLAFLGPVRVRYAAGLVHGWTHREALGKVPISVRLAWVGKPDASPVSQRLKPQDASPSHAVAATAAREEARAWADGTLPWFWWDEELSSRYWEEVFELFAVKESFETFELYAHLATQFSYVSLFGIAVPMCPLLAWLFASVEMRQDQLRLLWLSRPPQPHEGTVRFKRTVSLDAWYMIVRFTCYLSVIVNLLLWGLTYAGLTSTKPAEWTGCEWWRAIALFLVCQQACFITGSLFHRNFSRLDHDTAAAYLRRCSRLQHSIFHDDESPLTRREADRHATRRRFSRSPTRGLSSLI